MCYERGPLMLAEGFSALRQVAGALFYYLVVAGRCFLPGLDTYHCAWLRGYLAAASTDNQSLQHATNTVPCPTPLLWRVDLQFIRKLTNRRCKD